MQKFMTFKKDENKLLTLLGGMAGFTVSTFILFLIARNGGATLYVCLFALAGPLLGVLGANYLKRETKSDKEDIWDKNFDTGKAQKSKFNPDSNYELTGFGSVTVFVFAYLSIYLSEVLNLTKFFQEQNPDRKFSELFMLVAGNIFNDSEFGGFLISYWLGLTYLVVCIIIGTIVGFFIRKKKEREEKEKRNKSKFQ